MTDRLKSEHVAASVASEHSYGDIHSSRSGVFGHNTNGKSSHVHTMRSLGLFHELQEYVVSLEQTAEQQRQQLGRLKEEKRDVEKELMRELRQDKQPYVAHFQTSEVVDLPPRLRALFEDNKALKDKARKYKGRTQALEHQLAQKERAMSSLEEHVSQLKAQLQECSRSPAAVELEHSLKQQLETKNKEYQKLWQKQTILEQKIESDARSHKQALAAAAKERAVLAKDMAALQQQLEEKDKEGRAARLEAKQASRKLEELKKSAAAAVAAAVAAAREEGAAEVRRVRAAAESGVHLMLCIIREEVQAPRRRGRPVQQAQAQPIVAAPVYNTTARFQPDEAATMVQAAIRGHLTRKRLHRQRDKEQKAAVLIQAGARGLMARKQVQELKRQAEAAPVQVALGGAVPEEQHQQQQQMQQGDQQQQDEQSPAWLPLELPPTAGPSGRPAPQHAAKLQRRTASINRSHLRQAKPTRSATATGGQRQGPSTQEAPHSKAHSANAASPGRARSGTKPQPVNGSMSADGTAAPARPATSADSYDSQATAQRPFKSGSAGSRSRHTVSIA